MFTCGKRRLKTGDFLFHAEEVGEVGYFLHSGAVLLSKKGAGPGGDRRVTAGALIGESALYARVARRIDARVAEDAVVIPVPRETFRRVLAAFPAAADKVRAALAERTRHLVERLDEARVRSLDAVARKPGIRP